MPEPSGAAAAAAAVVSAPPLALLPGGNENASRPPPTPAAGRLCVAAAVTPSTACRTTTTTIDAATATAVYHTAVVTAATAPTAAATAAAAVSGKKRHRERGAAPAGTVTLANLAYDRNALPFRVMARATQLVLASLWPLTGATHLPPWLTAVRRRAAAPADAPPDDDVAAPPVAPVTRWRVAIAPAVRSYIDALAACPAWRAGHDLDAPCRTALAQLPWPALPGAPSLLDVADAVAAALVVSAGSGGTAVSSGHALALALYPATPFLPYLPSLVARGQPARDALVRLSHTAAGMLLAPLVLPAAPPDWRDTLLAAAAKAGTTARLLAGTVTVPRDAAPAGPAAAGSAPKADALDDDDNVIIAEAAAAAAAMAAADDAAMVGSSPGAPGDIAVSVEGLCAGLVARASLPPADTAGGDSVTPLAQVSALVAAAVVTLLTWQAWSPASPLVAPTVALARRLRFTPACRAAALSLWTAVALQSAAHPAAAARLVTELGDSRPPPPRL